MLSEDQHAQFFCPDNGNYNGPFTPQKKLFTILDFFLENMFTTTCQRLEMDSKRMDPAWIIQGRRHIRINLVRKGLTRTESNRVFKWDEKALKKRQTLLMGIYNDFYIIYQNERDYKL